MKERAFVNTTILLLIVIGFIQTYTNYIQSQRINILNQRISILEQQSADDLKLIEGIVDILKAEHPPKDSIKL